MLFELEIECKEDFELVTGAERPESRFEILVQCFLGDGGTCGSPSLLGISLEGLVPGERLSGSSINTATGVLLAPLDYQVP